MTGARVAGIVAYSASCVFLLLGAREFQRHGGFSKARTIVSHSGVSPQDSEDAWLLLEHAERILPDDTDVVFLDPGRRSGDFIFLSAAIALLPHAHARPTSNLAENPPPLYVIAFREPFRDPRYGLIDTQPNGFIYRRR